MVGIRHLVISAVLVGLLGFMSPSASAATDEWIYTGDNYYIGGLVVNPLSIAQDDNGDWWVTDGTTDNIFQFYENWTPTGIHVDVSASLGTIRQAIHKGSDGYWWGIGQGVGFRWATRFDNNWGSATQIRNVASEDATPINIFEANDGTWWMIGAGDDNVYQYPSGWGAHTGTTFDISTEDAAMAGIFQDDNGDWWTSGLFGSDVYKYNSSWTYTATTYSVSSETTSPDDIHIGDDGFWYLLDSQFDQIRRYYNEDWGLIETWTATANATTPPTISTSAATSIGGSSATLNGSLSSMGDYAWTNLFFQWRQQGDSTWRETSMDNITAPIAVSKVISGLSGFRTYDFRIVAEFDNAGIEFTENGDILSFSTLRVATGGSPFTPIPENVENIPEEEEEEEEGEVVAPEVTEPSPIIFTPSAPDTIWYGQYMTANERPEDAPFPTIEPFYLPPLLAVTEPGEPGADQPFFVSSILVMGALVLVMVVFRPPSKLGDTPENWVEGSGSGSWTFISPRDVVILVLAIGSSLFLFWRFGINTMSVTYGVTAGFSAYILWSQQNSQSRGSFIGLGDNVIQEAIFGAAFGGFFLLFTGWLGHFLGVDQGEMAITGAHALPLLVFSAIIPFQEEIAFRAAITPIIAERWGIIASVALGGLSFGLVHFLFGGSEWLLAVTTIFGVIMGYFTLRQKSIVIAFSSHLIYNGFSFVLWVLLIVNGTG